MSKRIYRSRISNDELPCAYNIQVFRPDWDFIARAFTNKLKCEQRVIHKTFNSYIDPTAGEMAEGYIEIAPYWMIQPYPIVLKYEMVSMEGVTWWKFKRIEVKDLNFEQEISDTFWQAFNVKDAVAHWTEDGYKIFWGDRFDNKITNHCDFWKEFDLTIEAVTSDGPGTPPFVHPLDHFNEPDFGDMFDDPQKDKALEEEEKQLLAIFGKIGDNFELKEPDTWHSKHVVETRFKNAMINRSDLHTQRRYNRIKNIFYLTLLYGRFMDEPPVIMLEDPMGSLSDYE